jgi:hypothetical protein
MSLLREREKDRKLKTKKGRREGRGSERMKQRKKK